MHCYYLSARHSPLKSYLANWNYTYTQREVNNIILNIWQNSVQYVSKRGFNFTELIRRSNKMKVHRYK